MTALHRAPVHALQVFLLDLLMTLAAGLAAVQFIKNGTGIGHDINGMGAMTIGTGRCAPPGIFAQNSGMHTLLVTGHRSVPLITEIFDHPRIRVTFAAGCSHVQGKNRGRGIGGGQDIMAAVTILATGRINILAAGRCCVDAFSVNLFFILMATAAIDRRQFRFMFNTLHGTMAIHATEPAMNRFFESGLVDI